MVKLVGVLQGNKERSTDCLSRRSLPLEVEPDLKMIMAIDDFCLACGPDRTRRHNADVDLFMRNYNCLDKDELSACLMVCWDAVVQELGASVPCVGCRRSVEELYHTLISCKSTAMGPLIVTEDGLLSINRDHMNAPESLANLFCHQTARFTREHLEVPATKKGMARRGGRCVFHTLETKKPPSSAGSWMETWDCMADKCREEVVLLPFSSIRETLEKYLKKHSFCCECANMVNKAFTLLIEEGKEPAVAAGEKCESDGKMAEDGSMLNADGSVNLFSGISACTKDGHVHVQCDPNYISQLLVLAEPELSGLKQERHAKTIEIAQKEVLICIGITLFLRFQRIHNKLREGEQTCDLLCLVALRSLRKSMDIAAERKRGVTDLELLCQEIEQADRDKERKQARKREKKNKQQKKKKDLKVKDQQIALDEMNKANATRLPPNRKHCSRSQVLSESSELLTELTIEAKEVYKARKGSGSSTASSDTDSGVGGSSGDTSPVYAITGEELEVGYADRGWVKGGSPALMLDLPAGGLKPRGHVCGPLACRGAGSSLMDLCQHWDDQEDEEEDEGISAEEILQFQSKLPQLNSQREQLRKNLRERFAALCVSGMH